VRIAHVITGLDTGGAELMLARLLAPLRSEGFESSVLSLTDIGPVGARIGSLGVDVRAVGMRRGVPTPAGLWRLAGALREARAQLVQTWMYHADLAGGLAGRMAGRLPVVWGIRHSTFDRRHTRALTRLTARTCAVLSHWLPRRIVCCSRAAMQVHAGLGYAKEKMLVIPNGFDAGQFHPDGAARDAVRSELGLPADARVIGMVGRFDPQKDHATFIEAARRLARADAWFVLCGRGVRGDNPALSALLRAAGLSERFRLLGERDDVPALTAAFDVATSSSAFGEAFPNVVGEAMACGVPCVVTDVGDAAAVVADTGAVVPARDPAALAGAWREMLDLPAERRAQMGAAARRRIEDNYALPMVARRYADLYREVLD